MIDDERETRERCSHQRRETIMTTKTVTDNKIIRTTTTTRVLKYLTF